MKKRFFPLLALLLLLLPAGRAETPYEGYTLDFGYPLPFQLKLLNDHEFLPTGWDDPDGHTSRPDVFAAGDAASGARTVVEAVANSKRVAEAMHAYMQSLPLPRLTDYPDVPVVETVEAAAQAEQVIP